MTTPISTNDNNTISNTASAYDKGRFITYVGEIMIVEVMTVTS
jgi:hypothetical protein